jgi:hypothetical protein
MDPENRTGGSGGKRYPDGVETGREIRERLALRGQASAAWAGRADGIKGLSPVMKSRRETQSSRKAHTIAMVKAMTWSPLKMLRRSSDIRASKPYVISPGTRRKS